MFEKKEEDRIEKLAKERTRLARERTSLAHIRTGFASFLFGIGLLGLFQSNISDYFAAGFILIGVLFLVTSTVSYLMSSERTKTLLEISNKFGRKKKEKKDD